jgi:hypothetical protein
MPFFVAPLRVPQLLLLALLCGSLDGCLVNPVPTPEKTSTGLVDNFADTEGATGGTDKDVGIPPQSDAKASPDGQFEDALGGTDSAAADAATDVPADVANDVTADIAADVTADVAADATETGDAL